MASFLSKSSAPWSRSARRLVKMARASSKASSTISRTLRSISRSVASEARACQAPARKEALRRRLIVRCPTLSAMRIASPFRCDIGRALKIVGRAGRNVAFEDKNFGGTPPMSTAIRFRIR